MSAEKNWQFELEEYIKQGEPGQIEKSEAWQTAIGLQAVDGLKTSAYLLELASKAKYIFERSQPEQKNKILRMLLANPTLKAKRLQLPLLKPFASVLDNSNSQNWLRRLGSNQRPNR